jgi:hypothetical protein
VEFAVSDIRDIEWNSEPFERLTIPDQKKQLIRAVAVSRVSRESHSFDDFVRGKGQGLVVLLQYACLAHPTHRSDLQTADLQVLAKHLLQKGCRSTLRNRFTP